MKQPYISSLDVKSHPTVVNDKARFKNLLKSAKNKAQEGNKADNHPFAGINTIAYLDYTRRLLVYRRMKGITAEALEVLILVYCYYKDYGMGVTSWTIASILTKETCHTSSELVGSRNKLLTLEGKGLIICLGKSTRGNAVLYCPTLGAISDLESIMK